MKLETCVDVEYDEDLALDPKWENNDYEYDSESDDELYNTPPNGPSAPNNRLAIKQKTPWTVGSTIRVKFLNGTDATKGLEHKIAGYAKTWTKYANIKFEFVDPSLTADIRIIFDPKSSRSAVGRDAERRDPKRATMHLNLDPSSDEFKIKRHTLHEFGHALGCVHEHASPASNIKWNVANVKKHYHSIGYTDERIDSQVLKKYGNGEVTQFSKFDKHSIMIYPIPADFTTNGYSVPWNGELSDTDKKFIGQIYPYPADRKRQPKPYCPPTQPVICQPAQPVYCPPPPPVVCPPPQPCINICGDPTCGQTHICDADYNRNVQPLGYSGIDRSKPNPPPQYGCQPTYYCGPRC